MLSPEKLAEFVNQSGFPLQIGIANLIDRTTSSHGWRVLYKEHSWKNNEDEAEGFLDLALENRHRTSVLVVECKRVLDTSWIFLQPGERIVARRHSKAWVTRHKDDSFKWFDWFGLALDPTSAQCEYCVVPGQDAKSRPLLERLAADLVSATEALAWEEKGFQSQQHDSLRMYFSVVVTTARLNVCVFDPEKISLDVGKLPDAEFQEVPYVRFQKQLSTRLPKIEATGWDAQQALVLAKEHTVFVVNSEALMPFLSEFEVSNDALRRLA